MFRMWPRWPLLKPNKVLGFFVWGLGVVPWVLGVFESDFAWGVQERGRALAEPDSVRLWDVWRRLAEAVDHGDSLTAFGSRHVADGLRWTEGVWANSYMLWGRPAGLEVGGRGGHRLRVWVDGWEPEGEDLHRISLEEVRSLRLDRVRGRILIRTADGHRDRPRAVVGRQVGSRQLAYSGLTFERPLGGGVYAHVAGHRGQVVDRGSHRGFNQEVGKIALDYGTGDERWRMRCSVLRGVSSRGVPGPYVRHPGRTLRDRWMRYATAVDRAMGRRGWLGVGGQMDGLYRRLRRPDAGRDVDRKDVDGGAWAEGMVLWSEHHVAWGRVGGRWRMFEDTEAPGGREDQRRTLSTEIEDVRDIGGAMLRSWGALRYDSKFGTVGSGGVQVEREMPRRGGEGERGREGEPTFTGARPHRVILSAGVGWTSRCPTFDEVYWEAYDVVDSMRSLPLQEEQGLRGWIAGRGRLGEATFYASAFAERSWDRMAVRWDGGYVNLPRTVEGGWDMGLAVQLGAHIGVEGAYAYRRVTAEGEGVLPYVPTHRARARIRWRRSYFRGELRPALSVGIEYVGARRGYDPGGARVLLDEGLFVQVRLETWILEDVQAFYQVDNLLDVLYEERPGYPAEGRAFRWGLRWTLWD